MNDREAMICRLKELSYSYNTYCTLDTLIRIDENVQVLSCAHCVFKDTISMGLCPISLLSQFHIVR